MLRLLILVFLYIKLFVVLQTWYIRHSEGFFEGAKPFFYPFGVKINVYGATIRPNFFVFPFLLFFLSFLLVSFFLFFSSYLSSYSSLLIYVYYLENPRKLNEKPHKNWPRLEEVTTAIEKNPGKDPPAIVFFCSRSTLIQSGSILSC